MANAKKQAAEKVEPAKKRPQTFDEAFQTLEDKPPPNAGKEAAEDEETPSEADSEPAEPTEEEEAEANQIPEWATLPAEHDGKPFKFPDDQPDVCFMRFRSVWTRKPSKGDRWCVLWPLTDNEEKMASKRVTDSRRTVPEMSKQMLRVIDGERVNWGTGQIDRFWNDIGPKCRNLIEAYYMKTHALSGVEQVDFFENCMRVVRATGG